VDATAGAPAPSLRFDGAAARATGFAGVNRYAGEYLLDGARLTFGPAVLTKMAGPPERMDLERRFTAALAATTRWRIRERQLELLAGDDYVLAKFAPNQ
jgi:heat shock protein HslJ